MKRSDAFPPNYLGQQDVPTPITAIIDGVHNESMSDRDTGTLRGKPVMTFSEDRIRPLILNNTNWTVLETAFGEDSDLWIGQKIELFTDPNIMYGKRRVGGIRVRIPQRAPAAHPTTQRPTTPAQAPPVTKPAPPPVKQQQKPPLTVEQKHALILAGYRNAMTVAKVEEFATWAGKQDFPQHMTEEQSDAYHQAMERLTPAVPMMADDGIPF